MATLVQFDAQQPGKITMHHILKEKQVPFSAEQMYRLVNDVAAYTQFVPYCTSSTVLSETKTMMKASLAFGIMGFEHDLIKTLKNKTVVYESLRYRLLFSQGYRIGSSLSISALYFSTSP
jgi:hypothetical protein